MKAISVESVSKIYRIYRSPKDRLLEIIFGRFRSFHKEFKALTDVSFSIDCGESIGVIGRNGAGKSTLLQILTGTLTPSSGGVHVSGKVAAVLELGSGFNPEFSGRDNVIMYASLFGIPQDVISARFAQIVEFSGLADFIDQPVKTYSSGMQARLAFSVIAHVDADILIIDEALSVGDAAFTQKCMRFLREFQRRGTILFVSHDMGAVTGFCDRAIWIEKGCVVDAGPAKDVCERYYAFMQSGAGSSAPLVEDGTPRTKTQRPSERSAAVRQTDLSASKAERDLLAGRQVIEMFGFNIHSAEHGNGDARILNVTLVADDGEALGTVEGGDQVRVRIDIEALNDVLMPIVGFVIKDRLGQPLAGGNTYHAYKNRPISARRGQFWDVEFTFKMPILAIGDYSIVAAIGNGTLAEHVHLHWVHDAVQFKVVKTSIEGVLVGMPLDGIDFVCYESGRTLEVS